MSIYKKQSYLNELDWEIYLLTTIPLRPLESRRERNTKILELTNKKNLLHLDKKL